MVFTLVRDGDWVGCQLSGISRRGHRIDVTRASRLSGRRLADRDPAGPIALRFTGRPVLAEPTEELPQARLVLLARDHASRAAGASATSAGARRRQDVGTSTPRVLDHDRRR